MAMSSRPLIEIRSAVLIRRLLAPSASFSTRADERMTHYKGSQKRCMLTTNRLRKVLNYSPATGVFRWRVSKPGTRARKVAGCARSRRPASIGVDEKVYRANRLVWLYITGKWPKLEISYINGDPSDNRWVNLREATPSQRRAKSRTTNKLGIKGVSGTKSGKYVASIKVDGKKRYLGTFDTIPKASAAPEQPKTPSGNSLTLK